MIQGIPKIEMPKNEPVLGYAPGSKEKKELKAEYARLSKKKIDIPCVIGGKAVRTGKLAQCVMPHDHAHVLGSYHKAGKKEVELAIDAAAKAKEEWSRMPWQARAAVFLKAADILAGERRMTLNAATMLGQSKNAFQAEIDAACELIDFFRMNVFFMKQILESQPESAPGMWNMSEARPLDGFVFAVTPFNFTSIAGNLPTAPAMMGNTVVWKPASSAVYSAWYIMQILKRAGLPAGVINMVPGPGGQVGDPAIRHPNLAGVHFTGSTEVFQGMWQTIGGNIRDYRCYPRIVGETGGKDFIFAHPSADLPALVAACVRGAFEYQGQKCSAASRAFIPRSLWPKFKDALLGEIATIKMGDPADFTHFMNAVIDRGAFASIKGYIDHAKRSADATILCGGGCDDSVGYFIEPTVIQAKKPDYRSMREEIFGPVLTVYVYEDKSLKKAIELCDTGSPYALTGAIFAQDRKAIVDLTRALRDAAGNFYINDKPTGAVVNQQPFGGSRASGTNDKAGSMLNMIRWTSPRTLKETFSPPADYRYPFLAEE
ncbi:MAG: L-glutamate gamma-semialdehyde dehydrogenase [Candidatus Eisenbacteria bacterium]|nr:L-glutamate gamma-semialdehyde dehydrogenase [Candidatus Eisenbacteria bacterium]